MIRGERDLSSTLLFYFNRPTALLLEKKLQSTFSTLIGFLYKELCKFLYIISVRNFCLYELNLWYLNRHILIYGRVYFHYDYCHILDFRIFRNKFVILYSWKRGGEEQWPSFLFHSDFLSGLLFFIFLCKIILPNKYWNFS